MNMAKNGVEGTAAMGIDAPLAVLSDKHQNLFGYFKQLFAQVTNPPIDAIREEVVTSTTVYIGADGNLLEERAENCRMLKVENPILTSTDLLKIKSMKADGFQIAEIPIIYYKNSSLEKAIDYLFIEVDRAIREGANILILSDRGVDEYHVAMPSLLALSGLQQHLVRTKKRTSVAIILETGEPREVHHFATLLGYGACAINPYLAHESIRQLIDTDMLQKDYYAAVDDYNHAVLSGIVKVASKMGISTIQSYQGAKIFEAIGLKEAFIDKYFTDTVSRIGGIGIEEIAQDYVARHSQAFDPLGLEVDLTLNSIGQHKSKSGGEKQFLNIATGGTAGTYYPLGGALAELLNNNIKGMNASAQSTGASVANVNMLKDGSVDLAFIQNDIAYYAVNGSEMFKDNKVAGLRGLAALYPETIQFVTTADKGIKSIADLKGKKVAVGAAGSGAEANARQILAAYGITYDDIDERFLSFGEAADALKDGNVDAGVVVAGFPTAAIQDLAANKSAAIINIDSDKADELMKKYPYYTKVSIPKGTYPGQEEDIHSVAVKCVVVTTDKMDDKLGGEVVKAIYEHLDRMKAAHAVGKYITKRYRP